MRYISTRGADTEGVSSAMAIKSGLASDSGLYMPEQIPKLTESELLTLKDKSYPERAAYILSKFLTDYTYDELLEDAKGAYGGGKFDTAPAKLTRTGVREYMLELWHGPTSAFKDMALQIMPRLFVRALRKCGEARRALILVATSGDTGKAALEGYRDIEGTEIKVFYPTDGVSAVQRLQMQTQAGNNVSVTGIRGNFDDAQSGVKRIFADRRINDELNGKGVFLSSANSINWGRLVPQIVYYISAYCELLAMGEITLGERISFTVPTGNFGNIFAGYLAKLMGLPIDKLICASNSNNVLTEFLRTGVYDRMRPFHTTVSPSMDILISSNLERLLYLKLGTERCRALMEELNKNGRYALRAEEIALIREDFIGFYADEDETKRTIKDTFENKNCLIDTHTAVAFSATRAYKCAEKADTLTVTVSTASPYKFASDVYDALYGEKPSDLDAPALLSERTGVKIPAPLLGLREKQILHDAVIDSSEMENEVLSR